MNMFAIAGNPANADTINLRLSAVVRKPGVFLVQFQVLRPMRTHSRNPKLKNTENKRSRKTKVPGKEKNSTRARKNKRTRKTKEYGRKRKKPKN